MSVRRGERFAYKAAASTVCISVPQLLLLMACVLEIPLGFVYDVGLVALVTYLVFIVDLYVHHKEIGILYVWYVAMSLLTVFGVYACESGPVDLYEISRTGHYVNALSTISLMFMVFFVTLCAKRERGHDDSRATLAGFAQPHGLFIAKVMLALVLILELYLIAGIYDRPYFSVGVERYRYLTEQMTPLASTIKGWLPIFIPCAVLVFKKANKFFPLLYFVLLVFIYVWTGDKFGTYFFAFAVTLYCALGERSLVSGFSRHLPKILAILLVAALALFGIGFFQRWVLYGTTLPEYWEFLLGRLAGQGMTWWSVFERTLQGGVGIDELPGSFLLALSDEGARSYPYAGQWKMMLAASADVSYTAQRIAVGTAYTTTTQATLFYYFSWFALVAIPFLALLCNKITGSLLAAVRGGDCLVAMLLVKLIISFNALYTSSEISAFTSPVTIAVLVMLFLLTRRDGKRFGATGSYPLCHENGLM